MKSWRSFAEAQIEIRGDIADFFSTAHGAPRRAAGRIARGHQRAGRGLMGIASMSNPATAIFSVLDPRLDLDSGTFTFEMGRGTAVAIHEDILVTCHHVVGDAKEVILFSHHPVFKGKKRAKGKVIRTDKNLDRALLRINSRLPFIELEEREDIDDSMPLRIWSWPGWNAWWEAWKDREKGIQAITSFYPQSRSPRSGYD